MSKVKIAKSVECSMKGVFEQGYTGEMIVNAVVFNRSELAAREGTHLYKFIKETMNYTIFEIVDILKGDYEVAMSREEKVKDAYRNNYEISCVTPRIQQQYRSKGFNEAIRFMNELYELNIELEEQ